MDGDPLAPGEGSTPLGENAVRPAVVAKPPPPVPAVPPPTEHEQSQSEPIEQEQIEQQLAPAGYELVDAVIEDDGAICVICHEALQGQLLQLNCRVQPVPDLPRSVLHAHPLRRGEAKSGGKMVL